MAFLIKIFAVSFGMGVVPGIVMPFQFDTPWSCEFDLTGSVVGVLLFIALISVWTSLADARISARWFSDPNWLWFAPVPMVTR